MPFYQFWIIIKYKKHKVTGETAIFTLTTVQPMLPKNDSANFKDKEYEIKISVHVQ